MPSDDYSTQIPSPSVGHPSFSLTRTGASTHLHPGSQPSAFTTEHGRGGTQTNATQSQQGQDVVASAVTTMEERQLTDIPRPLVGQKGAERVIVAASTRDTTSAPRNISLHRSDEDLLFRQLVSIPVPSYASYTTAISNYTTLRDAGLARSPHVTGFLVYVCHSRDS
jgi:uncharacterized sporulation protein YeaH/YhbH (DUF444 family)